MYLTTNQLPFGESLEESARAAIKDHFEKTSRVANEVLVPEGSTELKAIAVCLGNPAQIYQVPVATRGKTAFHGHEGHFFLDISHGNLEAFVTA